MAKNKFVNPYIERGKRAEATKKITVTIPVHVLQLLTDERTRRQIKKLRQLAARPTPASAFSTMPTRPSTPDGAS